MISPAFRKSSSAVSISPTLRRGANDMSSASYTLGVDLGTTSVKVCLVNQLDQSVR